MDDFINVVCQKDGLISILSNHDSPEDIKKLKEKAKERGCILVKYPRKLLKPFDKNIDIAASTPYPDEEQNAMKVYKIIDIGSVIFGKELVALSEVNDNGTDQRGSPVEYITKSLFELLLKNQKGTMVKYEVGDLVNMVINSVKMETSIKFLLS